MPELWGAGGDGSRWNGERYTLHEPFQGGMAEVWKAHDRSLDRPVVVKFLKVADPDGIPARRFMREAAILARIESPQVVKIHDIGLDRDNHRLFLVLQYIEGSTLRQVMPKGRRIPLATALQWAGELCAAVAQVHATGLVHRDLKPSNVILRSPDPAHRGSRLVLLDFGIARPLPGIAGHGGDLTQVGQLLGTPAYMSPEQFAGETAGPAADLYAIGCMLFEMAAGRQPYAQARGDFGELARLHRSAPVPRLRELRPDVPEGLDDLVHALLAKDPRRRPPDAREVVAALADLSARPSRRPGRAARPGPSRIPSPSPGGRDGSDPPDDTRLRRVEELFEKAQSCAATPGELVARLEEVRQLALRTLPPHHAAASMVTLHLALAVRRTGDPATAADLLAPLTTALRDRLEPADPLLLTCVLHLARFTGEAGGGDGAARAAALLTAALAAAEGLPADDGLHADARFELAHWLHRAGDPDGSAAVFGALLADYDMLLGPGHNETRQLRDEITRRFPPPSPDTTR